MTVTSVKKEADPDVLHMGLSDGSSFLLRISCLEALLGSGAGVESGTLFAGTVLYEDLENRLRLAGTA